ncbi:MAG: hypothetical protein ACW981_18605 [Candidatus Hodarchaeales archaeon]|jgi:hypothetical protein
MKSVKIPISFWLDLLLVIIMSHIVYTGLINIFAIRLLDIGAIGFFLFWILYLAPIPVMIKAFVYLEKKDIEKGKYYEDREKKRFLTITYTEPISDYFIAIFLSIGIYFPFIILSIALSPLLI